MDFFKKGLRSLRLKGSKPSPFGELEEKVMNIIWDKKSATVSQVKEALKDKFAYTTIMTVMDRLYKKGILQREKEGKGYRYYPTLTKEEFEKELAKKVVKEIIREKPSTVVSAFEGVIEELPEEEIRKIKSLIEKRLKDEK